MRHCNWHGLIFPFSIRRRSILGTCLMWMRPARPHMKSSAQGYPAWLDLGGSQFLKSPPPHQMSIQSPPCYSRISFVKRERKAGFWGSQRAAQKQTGSSSRKQKESGHLWGMRCCRTASRPSTHRGDIGIKLSTGPFVGPGSTTKVAGISWCFLPCFQKKSNMGINSNRRADREYSVGKSRRARWWDSQRAHSALHNLSSSDPSSHINVALTAAYHLCW